MYPTSDLALSLADAMAADSNSIADGVSALKVHLIAENFDPAADTDFTALTAATFTGSTAKTGSTGAQNAGRDPTTNELVIGLKEPAGGWRWEATADPAVPEVIYGYAVTDNAGTTTWGSGKLPEPVTITSTGDFVEIGSIELRMAQPIGT